jgi:hypothetical protein
MASGRRCKPSARSNSSLAGPVQVGLVPGHGAGERLRLLFQLLRADFASLMVAHETRFFYRGNAVAPTYLPPLTVG